MKKRLLSGIKPTGHLHLGNYFGAIRQFVEMQKEYDSFVFIADYHALTNLHDKQKLIEYSKEIAFDYLALGLDPNKVTLFRQSDVPEVTELAWIFDCITTVPYLMRAHAFKDAEAKNKEISVGTFNYPMLMAADILIYKADRVPVGKDQKQHVEMARDTAQKFNYLFGETFNLPEPVILEEVETVPGLDGRKMSKSYNNTIEIFASDQEIEKAIMSIPTDSKGIEEQKSTEGNTLFAIHSLLLNSQAKEELKSRYEKGGMGYKEAKENLIRDMKNFLAPFKANKEKLLKDQKKVEKILKKGAERASKEARAFLKEVKNKIGFSHA